MFARQKQKLFGKRKTVDEAFEEQRENFKKLQKNFGAIQKDLARYDANVKGFCCKINFDRCFLFKI